MPHRRSARLAAWQKGLLCVSGGLLWLSGAVWLVLHNYFPVQGLFGAETNPAEPWLMRLHGAVMIPALMGIGAMFVAHIPKGWDDRRQRLVGVALGAVLTVLIVTGYLLYYLGEDGPRGLASKAHWIIGLVLPLVFGWHWLSGIAARRR